MKAKRLKGIVKYWNALKGFGFIRTEGQEGVEVEVVPGELSPVAKNFRRVDSAVAQRTAANILRSKSIEVLLEAAIENEISDLELGKRLNDLIRASGGWRLSD